MHYPRSFDCYLLEHLNETYLTIDSFTDLQSTIAGNQYSLHYYLAIPDTLVDQALHFQRYLLGVRPGDHPLSRTIKVRSFADLQLMVVRSYLYSYKKVIFHVLKMYRNGFNASIPFNSDNLVFGGHALMLQTLTNKYLRTVDPQHLTVLFRRLDIYEKEFSLMTGHSYDVDGNIILNNVRALPNPFSMRNGLSSMTVDAELINLDDFDYFEPELEACLADLKANYPNVWIENLADMDLSIGANIVKDSPLGNCCYSADGNLIYATTSSGMYDMPSKYWNLAVGVNLSNDHEDDIGRDSYLSINTSDLDGRSIAYMVESITGMLFGQTGFGESKSRPVDDTIVSGTPPGTTSTALRGSGNKPPKPRGDGGSGNPGKPDKPSKKMKGKLKDSAINVLKTVKKKTVDNKDVQGFIKKTLEHASVKAIDASTQAFLTSIIIDIVKKKGIGYTSDSREINTGLPLLHYTDKSERKQLEFSGAQVDNSDGDNE